MAWGVHLRVPGMMGPVTRFSRTELESFRDAEVPDLVGPDLRLVFVGINPWLWTAATQTHVAHPANRFYPALYAAGILTEAINPRSEEHTSDLQSLMRTSYACFRLQKKK